MGPKLPMLSTSVQLKLQSTAKNVDIAQNGKH